MKCPACSNSKMSNKMTTAGVVVDHCEFCSGVWLEQGEIFLFSKDPMKLNEALTHCFTKGASSDRLCPNCRVNLQEGSLFRPDLRIDHCPKCVGLWFDNGELAQAIGENPRRFNLKLDSASYGTKSYRSASAVAERPAEYHPEKVKLKQRRFERGAAVLGKMARLPNLFLRAAGAMAFLYSLLALVLIIVMEYFKVSPHLILALGVGAVFFQFLVSPFIMDLTLRWFYRCSWVSPEELPSHLKTFVEKVTGEQKMKFPSFGVIDDGAPNAFTYGHTPGNARVVITRGLKELLEEDELEAVVAHELGHAKHWDILLMTVAALVPLIIYYIYRALTEGAQRASRGKGSKESGKAAAAVLVVAMGVYIAYIVAEYVVLWFSRTREFYADRFSGTVTDNPNLLSSALVKIAYGLAGKKKEEEKRSGYMEAVGALGIFDATSARALAFTAYGLTAQSGQGAESTEAVVGAMQWDMWNPWAKWYELHSTHPLVAKRLNFLGDQAASMGWEPYVTFRREKPESYWDEFLVDFLFYVLPVVTAVAAAVGGYLTKDYRLWLGVGLLAVGYTGLVKAAFKYRGKTFPGMSVASLLRKVKVSMIRPVPVTLKGRVIGKGVPGLIWSEDFVIQDDSGIIMLDYRQPLAIWELLFGILKAGEYTGKEVEVRGWFRRAPVPYVELRSIATSEATRRCYALEGQIITFLAMMIAGGVVAASVFYPVLDILKGYLPF